MTPSGFQKRSMALAGHRTSIALEPPFWEGLEVMARQRGLSMQALVTTIDAERAGAGLASALRLAVLAHYRDQTSDIRDDSRNSD